MKNFFINIAVGTLLVCLVNFFVVAIHVGPIVFHAKWATKHSPYNVGKEFVEANFLRAIRHFLYNHNITSDNIFEKWLYQQQLKITDRAFTLIPSGDGERFIWQIWLDEALMQHIKRSSNTNQIMPKILEYFNGLTETPMAAEWASEERFLYAYTFAQYYFLHADELDLAKEQIVSQKTKLAIKMSVLESNLKPAIFSANSEDYYHVAPLVWNSILYRATGNIIHNKQTNTYNCDPQIIDIFLNSRNRTYELSRLYRQSETDEYSLQWINRADRDIVFDPLPYIEAHCPRDTFRP